LLGRPLYLELSSPRQKPFKIKSPKISTFAPFELYATNPYPTLV
jgi:hypothetical protein